MASNYKQIWAIKEKNKKIWSGFDPNIPNAAGIYILTREDENGFKYAYIGQASRSILERLAEHLSNYQHIDLSLKKHKLYDEEKNPYGYKLDYFTCSPDQLDYYEKYYIKEYALHGYQLRNHTGGSQGDGKHGIDNQKSPKGYYDGVAYGEQKAKKYVKEMFDKYLDYSIKDKPNKIKERKLEEFENYLKDFVQSP